MSVIVCFLIMVMIALVAISECCVQYYQLPLFKLQNTGG